jgi:hypothetical protein
MSVETALGLSAAMAEQIIDQHWDEWAASGTGLTLADQTSLRHWLRNAPTLDANAALYDLAVLAAKDGGDDTDAALLLAFCLLPAACRIAHCLADVDPREVDQLVASQLWIEVRTYNWQACTRVTGTICANLRRNVLRELRLDPDRPPRATVGTSADVVTQLCDEPTPAELSPRQELLEVLDWGVDSGTIEAFDRDLLVGLVDVSLIDPQHRSPRRPLLGSAILVGPQFGVSPRTVRRRSRHALDALAAHATELTQVLGSLAS